MQTEIENSIIDATSSIISSYVQRNTVDPEYLSELVASVLSVLLSAKEDFRVGLETATSDSIKKNFTNSSNTGILYGRKKDFIDKLVPAVPVEKSVTPDYLICLEDGKKFRCLKRHLKTSYNISPDEYRKKWNLPDDYPMVAPNYTVIRSELAKKIRLGSKMS